MLDLDLQDLDLLDAELVGTDSVDIAIASGNRDVDALTDVEFSRRHPERGGAKIQKNEPALAQEWKSIRDNVVRPALARATTSTALTVASPASEALVSSAAKDGWGWSVGRVLKYGLGGLASVLLLGWAFKHREGIGVEARAATRHAGQLAGRAKATLQSIGTEHRSLRQGVAQERRVAQRAQRTRKLQAELVAADRRVEEARRVAVQKAQALQALRET